MHIVIIGNGIAGISAARYIRKQNSEAKITVVSAETAHFYSRTALMYIYMGHMTYENTKPYEDWFWSKNRIGLLQDYVETVDFDGKVLVLQKNDRLSYDKLIIAAGSKSNKFGWPGQNLDGVQGLYNRQDLTLLEENTKNIKQAVIVGGGLIGVELGEMLMSRRIKVTFLVRESSYWNNVLPPEESDMINRHIREHHVDLHLNTELKEIVSDENGRAKGVVTSKGTVIDCQLVGLTAGVSPNVDFLKGTELAIKKGVLVNEYLETNIPDVSAVGDCAQFITPLPNRRPIEQVWYTGRMQGITVAYTVCGNRKKYKPRTWFNSAKFFDIEYQTYGMVMPKLNEQEEQLYWEHSDGKKCLKFVYQKNTQQLLGINAFGIRLRHEVCEAWLNEGRTLDYVLAHFKAANFDPEFYTTYEKEVAAAYQKQYPNKKINLVPKKNLFDMIFKSGIFHR